MSSKSQKKQPSKAVDKQVEKKTISEPKVPQKKKKTYYKKKNKKNNTVPTKHTKESLKETVKPMIKEPKQLSSTKEVEKKKIIKPHVNTPIKKLNPKAKPFAVAPKKSLISTPRKLNELSTVENNDNASIDIKISDITTNAITIPQSEYNKHITMIQTNIIAFEKVFANELKQLKESDWQTDEDATQLIQNLTPLLAEN